MNTPHWLSEFQRKLKHNQVDLVSSRPILLQDPSSWVKPAQYADDHVIIEYNDDHTDINHYHIIDPFAHISKRRPGGCLEQSLVMKYSSSTIVSDDSILARIHQKHPSELSRYHVVLLNAIPDFVRNYYLKIQFDQPEMSQIGRQYQLGQQLQCIAFIDDNGSYFCALPALATYASMDTYQLNKDKDGYHLNIVEATIQQVATLLKPMPLLKIRQNGSYNGGYYPFQGISYHSHTYEVHNELGFTYETSMQSKISGYKLVTEYVNNPLIALEASDYTCHDLNYYAHEAIFEYLDQEITVNIDQNGNFKFHLKHETPDWTTVFTHLQQMNLSDENIPSRYLWGGWLYEKLAQHVLSNFDFTPQQPIGKTTTEDLTLTNLNPVKPLIPSTGLNDIFLTLTANKNHKYYLYKTKLVSLYGTSKIEAIEWGDLDETAKQGNSDCWPNS